jgi:hypothetical protein
MPARPFKPSTFPLLMYPLVQATFLLRPQLLTRV